MDLTSYWLESDIELWKFDSFQEAGAILPEAEVEEEEWVSNFP